MLPKEGSVADMKVAVLLASLCAVASARDNPSEQYYGELDCTPITDPGDEQPSRYDCSHLNNLSDDLCYHKGKLYQIGDNIPDEETSPCVTNCRCIQGYLTKKAQIECVNIECPSLFGAKPKEGCYFQYEIGKCCSTKENCKKEGEIATCEWKGKTYKEGEQFYPTNECKTCICTKEFDGTLNGPWCKRFNCDLHLHYDSRLRKGCIPAYYKVNDCCPIPVFRCPSDADKIEGEPLATAKSGENQCSFGDLKIAKGQRLNVDPDNKCVRCSCEVPPHVSCIMDRPCYEGDRYKPDE